MASSPQFGATPNIGRGNLTAASTGYGPTAPTNTATVFTAGVNGSKVKRLNVKALVTVASAQIVRFWYYDGTNYNLWKEILMPVTSTVSATVKTGEDGLDVDWDIPANKTIVAGCSQAQSTTVIVEGQDY